MGMWAYELIEGQTGNLMASYESEEAARSAVSERVHRHGPQSVASLDLVRVDTEDEDGAMVTLASGAELLKIAPQYA